MEEQRHSVSLKLNESTSRSSTGFLVRFLAALVLIVLVVLTTLFVEELGVQELREPVRHIRHFYTVMIRWIEFFLDKYYIPI